MFKSYLRVVVGTLTLASLIIGTGCATIVSGGSDKVPVTSKPDGANVFLNGQYVGKTPMTVTIGRKDDAVFRFEKEGYETKTVEWNKVLNGWILGNVLLGGVIGIAIDLITSNQGKHSESTLYTEMAPAKRVPASATKEK